jgi:8-oxo-dGTP pyrophosphatase MutT (NUDIX family)
MDTAQYKKQAGCVAVRSGKEGFSVLLVTNKSGKNWVLPKGTVKKSEQDHEAAVRETEEEAGIEGDIVGSLGLHFDHKKEYAIQFFTLQVTKENKKWDEKSKRERKWFPIDEAIAIVKKKYVVEVLQNLKNHM